MAEETGPARGQAADGVVTELRHRITVGALPPGSPLRDSALAGEFAVSRNTMREALRILRYDGLVSHELHSGATVRILTPADVRDIYMARRAVEIRAVQDSGLAPEHAVRAVEAAIARAEEAQRDKAWSEVGTASLAFHQALVALLASPSLDAFFATVVARLRLAFAVMTDEGAFQAPWVPRDRHIGELLWTGHRDEAEKELRNYLDDSERKVLDVVRAQQPQQRRARRRISVGGKDGER